MNLLKWIILIKLAVIPHLPALTSGKRPGKGKRITNLRNWDEGQLQNSFYRQLFLHRLPVAGDDHGGLGTGIFQQFAVSLYIIAEIIVHRQDNISRQKACFISGGSLYHIRHLDFSVNKINDESRIGIIKLIPEM